MHRSPHLVWQEVNTGRDHLLETSWGLPVYPREDAVPKQFRFAFSRATRHCRAAYGVKTFLRSADYRFYNEQATLRVIQRLDHFLGALG